MNSLLRFNKPKSISVYALTILAVATCVIGVGYALSCDSHSRTRGRFNSTCWHTGAALILGGGGTAAGTWKRNPYIRENQANPLGGDDRELVLDKLDEIEDEIIELRSSINTIIKHYVTRS